MQISKKNKLNSSKKYLSGFVIKRLLLASNTEHHLGSFEASRNRYAAQFVEAGCKSINHYYCFKLCYNPKKGLHKNIRPARFCLFYRVASEVIFILNLNMGTNVVCNVSSKTSQSRKALQSSNDLLFA